MKNQIIDYKPKQYDPTAWECYKQEHPDKSGFELRMGFVLMTFGVMGLILGSVYVLQHLQDLIMPAILVIGGILFARYK